MYRDGRRFEMLKNKGRAKILKRPKFQNFRQNWLGLESAGNWG